MSRTRHRAPPQPVSVLIASEFSPSPALEAKWLALLPAERRARLAAGDRRARHRSLLAHRLLGEALRRHGFAASVLATLRYPARARPTLDVPVQFSLSHCDGRIACVVSTGGPVGIDVEALAGVKADGFIRYLSAAERTWAGRSSRRFYLIWTRKEAVVKAAGICGLAELPGVVTMPDEPRATFGGRTWQTVALPVGRGHVGHLALAEGDAAVRVERVLRPALEAADELDP